MTCDLTEKKIFYTDQIIVFDAVLVKYGVKMNSLYICNLDMVPPVGFQLHHHSLWSKRSVHI